MKKVRLLTDNIKQQQRHHKLKKGIHNTNRLLPSTVLTDINI